MLSASNVKIALLVHVDHKAYNKILYVNSILEIKIKSSIIILGVLFKLYFLIGQILIFRQPYDSSTSGKSWWEKLVTPPPTPPVVKKCSTSGGGIFTPVPPVTIPIGIGLHQFLHQ